MRATSMISGAAIFASVVLLGASVADAGLTAEGCQARKVKAQGKFLSCRASEVAKGLQGKPVDLSGCQARFADALAKLNAQAGASSIQCRYRDEGDGTVTDLDTGLQWEKKTNDASLHDVSNAYSWSTSGTDPDGTLFSDFLARFNDCESSDGVTTAGGLGGHCDWRLPSIAELRTIQVAFPCGTGPCIDPAFGPTAPDIYWSATTVATSGAEAWTAHFHDVDASFGVFKNLDFYARAVRGGL